FQFKDIRISPLDMILQIYRKDKKRLKKGIEIRKKWLSLDKYFGKIWDKLIEPCFNNFNITNPFVFFLENHFDLKDDSSLKKKSLRNSIKKSLNILIEDMKKKVKKIADAQSLEQEFYFKPVTILHFNYKRDFEGFLTFKRLLLGTLDLKDRENLKEKIILKRIIHKINASDSFFYSYAILLNESGWIVFYELGTDDPMGTSNDYRLLIEDFIRQMELLGDFEIETFEVSSELLIRRYLPNLLQRSNLVKFGRIFLSEFKGSYLELLIYYYLTKTRQIDIFWSEKIKSTQSTFEFDLVYKDNNELLHLIECKNDLHDKYIDTILNKIDLIKTTIQDDNNFKSKIQIKEYFDYILEIWVWNENPFFDYEKRLNSHPNISIIKFKELFMKLDLDKERKQKCIDFMNYDLDLDDLNI
ncbi:MAG: hypothetical protein JW891_08275, partial [Candidatus Lokiarchaeota archaeon]|nr:hypothetical protein [Candidatus Lokiarchaeota archaeon]